MKSWTRGMQRPRMITSVKITQKRNTTAPKIAKGWDHYGSQPSSFSPLETSLCGTLVSLGSFQLRLHFGQASQQGLLGGPLGNQFSHQVSLACFRHHLLLKVGSEELHHSHRIRRTFGRDLERNLGFFAQFINQRLDILCDRCFLGLGNGRSNGQIMRRSDRSLQVAVETKTNRTRNCTTLCSHLNHLLNRDVATDLIVRN